MTKNLSLDRLATSDELTIDEFLVISFLMQQFPDGPPPVPVQVIDKLVGVVYESLQLVKRRNPTKYHDLVDAGMVVAGQNGIRIVPDPATVSVI